MAVVNELVTKFTFEGSLAPLGDFQKGLKNSIIGMAKFAAVGIAAALGVGWAIAGKNGKKIALTKSTKINLVENFLIMFFNFLFKSVVIE